jgi:hypothetical protein
LWLKNLEFSNHEVAMKPMIREYCKDSKGFNYHQVYHHQYNEVVIEDVMRHMFSNWSVHYPDYGGPNQGTGLTDGEGCERHIWICLHDQEHGC